MDLAPPNLIGFTLKRTSAKCSKNQPHRLRVLSTLIHTTFVQTSFVDNPRLVYAALPALSESHKTIAPKEDVEHTCASRCRCASGCVVVPDLQLGGCRFESRPGLLHTNVYSAFHPSGVGKWVPAAAGKAKAVMAHSDCGWTCGCAGKTVKSLENTCHTWALLRW